MSDDDLPMISTDSTQVEITPLKEAKVGAPEPTRPPAKPASAPAPASQADPRKASEARKPAAAAPARPANDPSATRPVAPVVRPAAPAASEDEDPEKLLREYADRQKTKMVRLEQQVVEYKKIVGERDALKAKVDSMTRELQDARRQVEASAKNEEIIKDLQGKVDAAILSNSILSEDKEKLKKALSQQTDFLKKSEEKNAQTEKALAEMEKQLIEEGDAREDAEGRIAAALTALQSDAPKPAAKAAPERASEAPTRPMPAAPPAKAPADERTPAPVAKPAPGKPSAPGRFSFLKK